MIVLVFQHVWLVGTDKMRALLWQSINNRLSCVRFTSHGHITERGATRIGVDSEITTGLSHRCLVHLTLLPRSHKVVIGGSRNATSIDNLRRVLNLLCCLLFRSSCSCSGFFLLIVLFVFLLFVVYPSDNPIDTSSLESFLHHLYLFIDLIIHGVA